MEYFTDEIGKAFKEIIESEGLELYKYQIIPLKRRVLIRIYIDSETGVNVSDCERVSKRIQDYIFTEDIFEKNYNLEVSSPGMNRDFNDRKDFERNIGRRLKMQVHYEKGVQIREGKLMKVLEEGIMIENKSGEQIRISFTEIKDTKIIPEIN